MRVAQLIRFGGPEVLTLAQAAPQAPVDDQALVRITSAGLNRADCLYREGKHYVRPQSFPARIGYEAAGIVEAVGPAATFKIGDRVAGLPCGVDPITQGGFAEYMTVSSQLLLPTPSAVSDRDAGSLWMAYLTAGSVLLDALHPDDIVVVTAASSSVGLAAIALGKLLGATVLATTTHEAKRAAIAQAGADHVINTKEQNYLTEVRKAVGGGNVNLFFDAVCGPMVNDHIRLGAVGSQIVIYGLLDTSPWTPHIGLMIGKHMRLQAFNVGSLLDPSPSRQRLVELITHGVNERSLPLHIDRYFPLDELTSAQVYLESNEQIGKIVVVP